jgi:hypothetical protein
VLQFWDGASLITKVKVSYSHNECGEDFEWDDERVFWDDRFFLKGGFVSAA